MNTFW